MGGLTFGGGYFAQYAFLVTTSGPVIEAAYLDDFFIVTAEGRWPVVDTEGRFIYVEPVGRVATANALKLN